MFSRSALKCAQAAAHYYEKDDYYSRSQKLEGEQIAPSSWWGQGAERLGLEGEVDRDTFQKLLKGLGPDEQRLRGAGQNMHERVGIDFTASAPKSISLQALLGGDERLIKAHQASCEDALHYLEQNSAIARQTAQGRTEPVHTENLLVARFEHSLSRMLDPQLHTHCVVLNTTQREDGKWRALHYDGLYAKDLLMSAGAIYRSALAERVQILGYQIRQEPCGTFELSQYSPEQLKVFSTRRTQIEARLEQMDSDSMWAKQTATLQTRPPKQEEFDRQAHQQLWQTRAQALDINFERPQPVPQSLDIQDKQLKTQKIIESALDHLTERQTVFTQHSLTRAAMERSVGQVSPIEVHKALKAFEQEGQLVQAQSHDGIEHRYTTKKALRIEKQLLSTQKKRIQSLEPICAHEHLKKCLEPFGLSNDQKAAVLLALSSTDGITAIQGAAGTGKTTALHHVRNFALSEGLQVRGFAPSQRAAEELEAGAQIQSQTLKSHLLQLRQNRTPLLSPLQRAQPKELWVLDEASMASNKDMLELLQAAERQAARVLLVGDTGQLPAIEAGAAFELLQKGGTLTAQMHQIQRQETPELLQAVEATLEQRTGEAICKLDRYIVEEPDTKARLQRAAQEYIDTKNRSRTLVLTPTNEDRVALNQLIREGLRKCRRFSHEDTSVQVLRPKDMTQDEQKRAINFAQGDVLRFQRGYRREPEIDKGERLIVDGIDPKTNVLQLRAKDGQRLFLNPELRSKFEVYRQETRALTRGDKIEWNRNDKSLGITNGGVAYVDSIQKDAITFEFMSGKMLTLDRKEPLHLDHGYACTIYKSQGRTVDKVIAYVDTQKQQAFGQEAFYVTISRQRKDLTLLVDDKERLPELVRRSTKQQIATEQVLEEKQQPQQSKARAQVRDFGLELEM